VLVPEKCVLRGTKKKNEDLWESESTISECDDFGTWARASLDLAEELGAEPVEFEVLDENVFVQQAIKYATKYAPAALRLGRTAPGAIVKAKPAAIVKAKPATTAITRGRSATTAITKSKPSTVTKSPDGGPVTQVKVRDVTKDANSVKVDLDTKTGQIVKAEPKTTTITKTQTKTQTKTKTKTKTQTLPQTQTQTKTQPKPQTQTQTQTKPQVVTPPPTLPPTTPPTPPIGPKPPFGIRIPKLGISLDEPKNVGKVVRV